MSRSIVLWVAAALAPAPAQMCRKDCSSPDGVCVCAFGSEPGARSSAPPSVIRLGSFEREPAQIGTVLEPGDQLIGAGVVDLSCPGGSRVTVAGTYAVLVLPATGRDCAFNLLRGTVHVIGEQPTQVQSGMILMGSKRTHYGVDQRRRPGAAPQTEVFVYEGEAECRPDPFSEMKLVRAGSKVRVGTGLWERSSLNARDVDETAAQLAWMDVSKARSAGASVENPTAVYEGLKQMYAKVLASPGDVDGRVQLARAQVSLGVVRDALYQLDKAEAALATQDSRVAEIFAARGKAFEVMGEPERARREFQKATRINPDTVDPATRRRYRLEAGAPRLQPK